MKKSGETEPKLNPAVELAARAAASKKATDIVVLDLRRATAFMDYFVIVSGQNQRQLVAIAEAVQEALRAEGIRPTHVEGYPRQEWILLDYGSFIVHIFSTQMRAFYDLERLWGGATRVPVAV
jgi:ribosome-associated protein